jgi:hypothetical protein
MVVQAVAIAALAVAPVLLIASVLGYVEARTLSFAALASAGVVCVAAIAFLFLETRSIHRRDI